MTEHDLKQYEQELNLREKAISAKEREIETNILMPKLANVYSYNESGARGDYVLNFFFEVQTGAMTKKEQVASIMLSPTDFAQLAVSLTERLSKMDTTAYTPYETALLDAHLVTTCKNMEQFLVAKEAQNAARESLITEQPDNDNSSN